MSASSKQIYWVIKAESSKRAKVVVLSKMECDLLLKEDEFYKENNILEAKTKEILQKVTDVMVRHYIVQWAFL